MLQQIINLVSGVKTSKRIDKTQDISFCETCGEVCGTTCRADSSLSQAKGKYSLYQTGGTGRY